LTRNIVLLASEYGRYGYRRIAAILNDNGIDVGTDRVQRIWRREWGEADKAILPVKGWPAERFHQNSQSVGACGLTTVHASDCDLSIRIMSGLMTLSKTVHMTEENTAC